MKNNFISLTQAQAPYTDILLYLYLFSVVCEK